MNPHSESAKREKVKEMQSKLIKANEKSASKCLHENLNQPLKPPTPNLQLIPQVGNKPFSPNTHTCRLGLYIHTCLGIGFLCVSRNSSNGTHTGNTQTGRAGTAGTYWQRPNIILLCNITAKSQSMPYKYLISNYKNTFTCVGN